MYKIWTELRRIKTVADVEVPKECILFNDQQGGNFTGFWLYVSLWENDPTCHLIYNLSKQFSN